MPRYLLSVCFDETYDDVDLSDPEIQREQAPITALDEDMRRQGVWLFTAGLRDASTSTVVRARDGQVSMTDGPFAETKEQMAGLWIIEVADREAALEWASRATVACGQPIEVRPVHDG
jgi:hypothetical protein